jgi:hypothetical protein
MRKNTFIISTILVFGIILVAGCVSSKPSESPPNTVISTPVEMQTVTSPETPQVRETLSTTSTPTTTVGQKKLSTDPSVNINSIKKGEFSIPNCTMGQLVPAVQDPGYGLNSVKRMKLYFMSPGDFKRVIREYTENSNPVSVCYGLPETPTWDFVDFSATIIARNARPATYNITMNVKSMGVDGPEYSTTMSLNPGQEYPVEIYVPIRNDQITNIAGVSFKFDQIS